MTPALEITDGPEVNGRKTSLHLFEAEHLASSPLLPSFIRPINAAFSLRHPPWLPASMVRMESPDQLPRELGPDAFTFGLVFADDTRKPPEVLATVSGKECKWKDPDEQDPKFKTFYWDKEYMLVPGYTAYEVKLLVVDPKYMRYGIGSLLLGQVEAEIRKRFLEKKLKEAVVETRDGEDSHHIANKGLRIILQTIYEMNGAYYEKRGWTLVQLRKREKGFMHSEVGFNYGSLEKVLHF